MKEIYNTPVVDIVLLNDVDVITYSKDNPASDAGSPIIIWFLVFVRNNWRR